MLRKMTQLSALMLLTLVAVAVAVAAGKVFGYGYFHAHCTKTMCVYNVNICMKRHAVLYQHCQNFYKA